VPVGVVLELLTAARGFGNVIEVVTWGPSSVSAVTALGQYGAAKVYDVGDIGESLPGPKVAAAMAARISGGDGPDAILIGATHDGRDIRGAAVRASRSAGAHQVVGFDASEGGLTTEHTIFGGRWCCEPCSPAAPQASS